MVEPEASVACPRSLALLATPEEVASAIEALTCKELARRGLPDADAADGCDLLESDEHLYLDPATHFPRRTIPASQLLEDSDEETTFCGPSPGPADDPFENYLVDAWGLREEPLRKQRHEKRHARKCYFSGLQEPHPLILPKGDIEGDHMKFICHFPIGLENDDDFCLVKRILGKGGENMIRLAEECNAKVRLRGRGSGFLERSGLEADIPLQLTVACADYADYVAAVNQVTALLRDLYKHYRRYCRSIDMEPADVRVIANEWRRDDLRPDQFPAKARSLEGHSRRDREDSRPVLRGDSLEDQIGPASVPSTPAGRRAAARAGGARAGALVSAAFRQAQRAEKERQRMEKEWREQKIQDAWERAARKPSRHAPLGSGLLTRNSGDAQAMTANGAPIGAFASGPRWAGRQRPN